MEGGSPLGNSRESVRTPLSCFPPALHGVVAGSSGGRAPRNILELPASLDVVAVFRWLGRPDAAAAYPHWRPLATVDAGGPPVPPRCRHMDYIRRDSFISVDPPSTPRGHDSFGGEGWGVDGFPPRPTSFRAWWYVFAHPVTGPRPDPACCIPTLNGAIVTSGVGYARLVAQLVAHAHHWPFVWFLDDNVRAFHRLDPAALCADGDHRRGVAPAPCPMADLLRTVERPFARGRSPLLILTWGGTPDYSPL